MDQTLAQTQACVKSLGIFRALNLASTHFISITFRITAGVLANVPLDTVALLTGIEFLMNVIFEVPMGYVADRFGRIPCALLGGFLILLGTCGIYVALFPSMPNTFSRLLFIIHGVIVGFSKPLISGSVEAFYQDAIRRLSKGHNEAEKMASQSFTLSQHAGKYLTALVILLAFVLLFVTYHTIGVHHTLIIGILLWYAGFYRLFRDFRIYGDTSISGGRPSTSNLISRLRQSMVAKKAIYLRLSAFMLAAVNAGYFAITLGRQFGNADHGLFSWFIMGLFTFAYGGIGWIVRGHVLPRLVMSKRLSTNNYLLIHFTLLATISLYILCTFSSLNPTMLILMILVYAVMADVVVGATGALATNLLCSVVDNEELATALSLQNMPAFAGIGFYSWYLGKCRDGAPSVEEAMITVCIICVVSIFSVYLLSEQKRKSSVRSGS